MPKRVKEPAPAEQIVLLEQPTSGIVAVVEPPIQPMEPATAEPTGPTFGRRAGRFFAFLLRLFIVLLLLAASAAGLYFGLPVIYEKYIVPVRENTAQLARMNNRLAQSEIAIADLQAKLEAAQTEQAGQAQSLSDLTGKVQKIEEQIASHTQTLAALEQMQSSLQAQNDATDAELARQIKLLKSMELLSRARLFMYQSNFGLARQDVQAARDLLAEVQPTADLADELAEVIHRLDLTLANLPAFPVAASGDLDIAWQILLAGFPAPQAAPVSATPVPEPTATPTLPAPVEPATTPSG